MLKPLGQIELWTYNFCNFGKPVNIELLILPILLLDMSLKIHCTIYIYIIQTCLLILSNQNGLNKSCTILLVEALYQISWTYDFPLKENAITFDRMDRLTDKLTNRHRQTSKPSYFGLSVWKRGWG